MQTGATDIPLFVAGRVFAGLGVGMVSCLVPMYQSECSPKWVRGAVVSCYQWAITIGLLLAAIVNEATHLRTDASSYRIPIAIQFVWAGILSLGMFFLPESPRWLIKRGRDADAARALARYVLSSLYQFSILRGSLTSLNRLLSTADTDAEVTSELEDIRANLRIEEELGENSYLDCFKQGPNKVRGHFFRFDIALHSL